MGITREQAKEFWRDFYVSVFHEEPNPRSTKGTMSTALIADHMGMDEKTTETFLWRCADKDLHLTDRQNGGWVV